MRLRKRRCCHVLGRYCGCYPEIKGARVFFVSAGTYDPSEVNPSVCTTQCARWGFRYAALTEGKFCFCSTRLPTAVVTTDGYCNIPCSDIASATMCGGLNYIRSGSSVSSPNAIGPFTLVSRCLIINASRNDLTLCQV